MVKEIAELLKEVVVILKEFFLANNAGKQLQKVRDIFGEMNNVVQNTPVERFLIYKTENGGGTIKPGVHLYTSLIYEMYRSPIKSNIAKYQRIMLDPSYVNIIVQTIQKQGISIATETLDKNSILDAIYNSEGVKYSEWYYIGKTKKAIYYCTVATTVPEEQFQEYGHRLIITLAVNKIRALFK